MQQPKGNSISNPQSGYATVFLQNYDISYSITTFWFDLKFK